MYEYTRRVLVCWVCIVMMFGDSPEAHADSIDLVGGAGPFLASYSFSMTTTPFLTTGGVVLTVWKVREKQRATLELYLRENAHTVLEALYVRGSDSALSDIMEILHIEEEHGQRFVLQIRRQRHELSTLLAQPESTSNCERASWLFLETVNTMSAHHQP